MQTEALILSLRQPIAGGLHAWLRLLRFPFHLSFVTVVLGSAAVMRGLSLVIFSRLAGLYLVFNIVLYGGLYILNALTDAGSDRLHPGKSRRPLACGAISRRTASVAAAAHILMAFLLAAWIHGPTLVAYFAAFTLINLAYSLGGRQIAYLEVFLNALTYPCRFAMGAWFAGGAATPEALLIVFLTASGVAATRRYIERTIPGWEARSGMRAYSPAILLFMRSAPLAVLLLMWSFDPNSPLVYYWIALPAYCVLVFGLHASTTLRRAFVRLWTK